MTPPNPTPCPLTEAIAAMRSPSKAWSSDEFSAWLAGDARAAEFFARFWPYLYHMPHGRRLLLDNFSTERLTWILRIFAEWQRLSPREGKAEYIYSERDNYILCRAPYRYEPRPAAPTTWRERKQLRREERQRAAAGAGK